MKNLMMLIFLSSALVLTGCPKQGESESSGSQPPKLQNNPTPIQPYTPKPDISDHQKAEILTLVNQARATARYCGSQYFAKAAPVKWNDKLYQAAIKHSEDMANKNYFDHTGSDGREFDQRIEAEGYRYATAAENINAGRSTPKEAMDSWLKSAGHCKNIMNPNMTEVAVAHAYGANSRFKDYWTMLLGRPR